MRIRHSYVVLVILMGLIFLTPLLYSLQPAKADWHQKDSGQIDRDLFAGDHTWHRWTGLTTDHKLHYDWTSGIVTIDFMIFDEDNYNLWSDGQSASAELVRGGVTSVDLNWTVSRNSEIWYIVWSNPGLLSTHITADWHLYRWYDPADLRFTSTSVSASCEQGDSTTATFYVRNYGEESGSALLVMGSTPTGLTLSLSTYQVDNLGGGASRTITATISATISCPVGSYMIDIDLREDSSVLDTITLQVTVSAPGDGTTTPTTTGIPLGIPGFPWPAILIGLVIALVVARKRKIKS